MRLVLGHDDRASALIRSRMLRQSPALPCSGDAGPCRVATPPINGRLAENDRRHRRRRHATVAERLITRSGAAGRSADSAAMPHALAPGACPIGLPSGRAARRLTGWPMGAARATHADTERDDAPATAASRGRAAAVSTVSRFYRWRPGTDRTRRPEIRRLPDRLSRVNQ